VNKCGENDEVSLHGLASTACRVPPGAPVLSTRVLAGAVLSLPPPVASASGKRRQIERVTCFPHSHGSSIPSAGQSSTTPPKTKLTRPPKVRRLDMNPHSAEGRCEGRCNAASMQRQCREAVQTVRN